VIRPVPGRSAGMAAQLYRINNQSEINGRFRSCLDRSPTVFGHLLTVVTERAL
jgi:hypothetical protein